MPEPPAQEEPAPSFMDRIPDVEADYPPQPQDPLTEPQLGQEITPDEHAIKYNGLLDHGEEEPPFDMDLLNEFAPPAEPEPPQEEVDDQEYRDNGSEFNDMFEASAPEDQVPSHQRPTRKGRPKRKKGEGLLGIPNLLATVVWLALILASLFRLHSLLISEDFPTLDRPANTISGYPFWGYCFFDTAEITNSA